jgi:hypothetical protein
VLAAALAHCMVPTTKLTLTDAAIDRVPCRGGNPRAAMEVPNAPAAHSPSTLAIGHNTYALFRSPLEGEAGPISFSGLHEKFLRTL